MKAIFSYKDHTIVLERTWSGATLAIDGTECEKLKDGLKVQLRKFELKGKIENADGTCDEICIKMKPGFLMDTFTLCCNGKEIENKQFR